MKPGDRLGPYEIVAPIGAGGMGEVYRGRDSRLGRDVALKVLPLRFSADAGRMARFQREAQLLASLNHPHIASLYGLEESGGVRALVMDAERRELPRKDSEALPSAGIVNSRRVFLVAAGPATPVPSFCRQKKAGAEGERLGEPTLPRIAQCGYAYPVPISQVIFPGVLFS